MMQDGDRFDSWLSGELHRQLDPVTAAPAPRPRYAARRAGRRWWLVGGAGGALTAKLAGGLVVAAFAVGATGTALTGSPNPVTWGSHIRDVVEGCKDARTATDRGIGDCVSAIATTHGPEVSSEARTEHPTPPATSGSTHRPSTPAPGASQPEGPPSSKPNPHGPPTPKPTAKAPASPHPTSRGGGSGHD